MKILVLDREWSQTGYLVVNLAKAGFDVTLASGHGHEPWGLGRYCRMITAPKGMEDPVFIERVLRAEQADIVFPVAETIQQIIWQLPESLTRNVFPATTEQQRRLLSDRPAMYEFTSSVDVPAPELMHLREESDLAKAVSRFGFPLVLRGTQGLAGDQVRVVSDMSSAQAAHAYLCEHSPAPPFAQAFISGQRCLIGGLFDHGKMLQWFSQTTIEASSATGPSLRVRSIREPLLTEYAERLFRGFGWDGLACAEFMRTTSGEFYFLEINPRPWAAIQAAHVCGVPLMRMFAEYLLGRAPTGQVDFEANKEVTLFPAFIDARLSSGRGLQSSDLGAWIQSLRAMPWQHPGLMVHFARKLRWSAQRGADVRKQVGTSVAATDIHH